MHRVREMPHAARARGGDGGGRWRRRPARWTELVTMEDLFISEAGRGYKDVLDGVFDSTGALPCQIDGGLKCFGHPIGASGIRMIYENYLQLLGRAGARQCQ